MSTARLAREIDRLRARMRKQTTRAPVPIDRIAFAKAAGLKNPDPWQEKLLRSESKRIILNCCRQSGKSTTSAIIVLYVVLHRPGSLVLVLSPSLRQSQEFHKKVLEAYDTLGRPMKIDSERRLGLELRNGSRLEALPGSEKTIRGFSAPTLVVFDEASRVPDALYYSVRPVLAISNGTLMLISTPHGKRGIFYQEWTDGLGWERYEVPATSLERISTEFLAEERQSHPPHMYQQEYLCKFAETEDQVFSQEIIERAFDNDIEPLWED